MYFLTITAKRKNAKRHIVKKGKLEDLIKYGRSLGDQYIVEIYDGRWNLVERMIKVY